MKEILITNHSRNNLHHGYDYDLHFDNLNSILMMNLRRNNLHVVDSCTLLYASGNLLHFLNTDTNKLRLVSSSSLNVDHKYYYSETYINLNDFALNIYFKSME